MEKHFRQAKSSWGLGDRFGGRATVLRVGSLYSAVSVFDLTGRDGQGKQQVTDSTASSAQHVDKRSEAVADERILVLDFGSQYAQLIARRVREQNVYCEIIRHDLPAKLILRQVSCRHHFVWRSIQCL